MTAVTEFRHYNSDITRMTSDVIDVMADIIKKEDLKKIKGG